MYERAHVEACKDLAWIGDESIRHVRLGKILSGWAGQAADVTAVKNYDMLKNLDRLRCDHRVRAWNGQRHRHEVVAIAAAGGR